MLPAPMIRVLTLILAFAVWLMLGVATTPSAHAQTFTVLHSFAEPSGDDPRTGLIQDQEGNLYGTTVSGGAFGGGTVFKLDPSGTFTVLHSFASPDGEAPRPRLVQDQRGNLYGTTYGTVFTLDPSSGTFTVLHSFTGPDGASPHGGLIRDQAGNLYGTTMNGGASNLGTVFTLDPSSGAFTVLHSFAETDGVYPKAGLIRDQRGNLYGTTRYGGALGGGTVFTLDRSGTFTVLHSFAWPDDGTGPSGGLIRDQRGNLYGTTDFGGVFGGGTIWQLVTGH